jgi:pSer/pThr/pTyr-binding forkhead associated (FHA) protein
VIVKSVTIGTAEDCDLRINSDAYVSARHARIEQHDTGRFVLTDIGSTNGTWIRRPTMGALMKVALGSGLDLRPGDVVRVGRTEIPWQVPA